MKTKSSKKANTREVVKQNIGNLYAAVERLQREMAIVYHVLRDKLEDLDKVHQQIENEIKNKILADQLAEDVTIKKVEIIDSQNIENKTIENEENSSIQSGPPV